jgi:hypothetical protein
MAPSKLPNNKASNHHQQSEVVDASAPQYMHELHAYSTTTAPYHIAQHGQFVANDEDQILLQQLNGAG